MDANFTILGAGAIGSILAAHLVRAGHVVTLVARGGRAAQVANEGLRIRGLADFSSRVHVLDSPTGLRDIGILIVATKANGTAAALAPLSHLNRPEVAFSIQNGIRRSDLLVSAFGRDRALGAVADLSGELLPTGEVLFTRNVDLVVGELAGGVSERAARIAGILDASGVRSHAAADISSLEWSKFLPWAGLAILAVTARATTGRILDDPDAALVLVRVMREISALANAAGIALTDRAILPVATLLASSEAEAVDLVRKSGVNYLSKVPEHRVSALQDFLGRRALELDETIGEALRVAASRGIAMPITENLYHLVSALQRMPEIRS